MPPITPVRFSPAVEDVAPDEAKTIEGLNDAFDLILERTSDDGGHAIRSVHAKSHGILEGELTIDGGLPPNSRRVFSPIRESTRLFCACLRTPATSFRTV